MDDAKRSRVAVSLMYRGLMPRRSRASVSSPVSVLTIANANMPLKCWTQSAPQRWNALRITSLSAVEKKE